MDIGLSMDFIINSIIIFSSVIGGASMVVAGLRKIATVTPTKKDDLMLAKVQKWLDVAISVTDKLALTPRITNEHRKSN